MFNKVILVGNLTREIDMRYAQSGTAIANAGIATNRKFKAQDGTQKEEICFVDITFFGRPAEVANQYLKRGSKVLVEGRLKLDQWQDQSGAKRSKHSVTVETMQMLGNKDSGNQPQQQQSYSQGQQNDYQQRPQAKVEVVQDSQPYIGDDEIPF